MQVRFLTEALFGNDHEVRHVTKRPLKDFRKALPQV